MSIQLVVVLEIKNGFLKEFLDIARKHGAHSVAVESGCQEFQVLVDQDHDNTVLLLETYQDQAALDSHWASDHMTAYLDRASEMIVSRQRYLCIA